jgi:hypothetical protein
MTMPRGSRAPRAARRKHSALAVLRFASKRAESTLLIACAILCTLLIACRWYAGPLPQIIFGHDMMVLLEGGWKWKWGIIPHRDFYSPFGALNYALVAWGSTLGGGMVNALPAAVCLVALCTLPAILYAAFTRMPVAVASLAVLVIMAETLAPNGLRFSSVDWTYAFVYNRWAYSLFCIALVVIALPLSKSSKCKESLDGSIVTACVVTSILVKISYGLLLGAVFLGYVLVRRRRLSYYGGAFVGALVLVGVFGILLHWSFGGLLRDMSLAAHARSGLGRATFAKSALYLYPELSAVLMLAGLCITTETYFCLDSSWRSLGRILFLFGCSAFCAVAIVASNSPLGSQRESPVLSICSLILLASILNNCRTGMKPSPTRAWTGIRMPVVFLATAAIFLGVIPFLARLATPAPSASPSGALSLAPVIRQFGGFLLAGEALLCSAGWIALIVIVKRRRAIAIAFGLALVLLTAAPATARNLQGLFQATLFRVDGRSLPADQVFGSGGLAGMQVAAYGGDPPLPTSYVGKVKDGLDLLERTGNAKKTLAVLDFSDPFDVVRGVRPAKGTPTCWQLDFVISHELAPPPEQVFEGVETVLLPKQFGGGNQEDTKVLLHHYGGYLASHFVTAAQSRQWVLMQERPKEGPR